MAGIRVKDRNNLGLGVPVRDVVLNELEVENGSRVGLGQGRQTLEP